MSNMVGFSEHGGTRILSGIGGAIIWAFAPSVVPPKYQPPLVGLGILILLVAVFWPVLERWPGRFLKRHVLWRFRLRSPEATSTPPVSNAAKSDYPPRHKIIVEQLAAPLAVLQEQALTYGTRNLPTMTSSRARAEALIAEIPYDQGTVQTVRDFIQACVIAADKHDTADEAREARNDVARIGPELFRAVHEGLPVNRSEVDLPDWCRVAESPQAAGPVLSPPQAAPETSSRPLDEVERGPCKAALIEIHGFLTGDLTTYHHDLAHAAISKAYSTLIPNIGRFRTRAGQAEIAAKSLEQRHALSLKRMDVELHPLTDGLRQLKNKLIRVGEGVSLGWPQSALKERVDPMHKKNLEVGQLAKDLIRRLEDKQTEFFGE